MRKAFVLVWLLAAALTAQGVSQQSGPGYLDPQRPVNGQLSVACTGGSACPANSTVQVAAASGNGICSVTANPSYNFSGMINFEQSNDGQNWQAAYVTPSNSGSAVVSAAGPFIGSTAMLALLYFRVRLNSLSAGTITITAYCVPARVSVLGVGPFVGGKFTTPGPTATPIPNPLTAPLGGLGANLAGATGCIQMTNGVGSVASPNPNPTLSPLPTVPCAPLLSANFVSIEDYGYQPQNPATFPAAFSAALAAAASLPGGGRVLMPGAGNAPTLVGDYTVPMNVVIQGTGSAFGSQFNIEGILTFAERAGAQNINIVAKNGTNDSDCGIQYAGTTYFQNNKFVLQNNCNNPLVGPSGSAKAPVYVVENEFDVTCSGCKGNVLLEVYGVQTSSAGHAPGAIVANNIFDDSNSPAPSASPPTTTQAIQIWGDANDQSSSIAVTGNVETGPDLVIPDSIGSFVNNKIPSPVPSVGNLTNVTYAANSLEYAPVTYALDSTSFIAANNFGDSNFPGKVTAQAHNSCSATSGITCEFTWTVVSLSSGGGTTTATVPGGSKCVISANNSPIVSSGDIMAYWIESLVSNTLTIGVQDLLGTASSAFSGFGICA